MIGSCDTILVRVMIGHPVLGVDWCHPASIFLGVTGLGTGLGRMSSGLEQLSAKFGIRVFWLGFICLGLVFGLTELLLGGCSAVPITHSSVTFHNSKIPET